jgi:hypothetical protein
MVKHKSESGDGTLTRSTKTRVNDFGRESWCTPASKAKLMKQIKDEGLPDAFSASTHARRRHKEVAHCVQEVEFDNVDGTTVLLPLQRPSVVLQHAVHNCPEFAALLRNAICDAGAAPLELVLYFDEIEPGDPLKKGDRNMLAIYWTLAQLGPEAMSNDNCWFALSVIRVHPVADDLLDGYCQIMCKVLDVFFKGGASFGDGVSLEFPSARGTDVLLLVASFDIFVSDEKAIKQLTGVKGAAGRKLCLFCMNTKAWRHFKPDPTGFFLPSNSLAVGEFKLHTDASLREVYRKVLAAKRTMGESPFLEYEREMGVSVNERYHPLLRDEFKPISSIVWDPQHVYLCGGIFEVECQAFFAALEKADCGLGLVAFDTYSNEWCWPAGYAKGDACARKGSWHGTASEYLSVAPVLAKWIHSVVQQAGLCPLECESMLEQCKTLKLLQLGMVGNGDPGALDAQILKAATAHQVAYGSTVWKPKHHHAFHMGTFLRLHKRLFSCFTAERKHKVPKKFAMLRHNTTAYERGLLEELLDQHFWELKKPLVKNALADPREAPPHMRDVVISELRLLPASDVTTARCARVRARTVAVHDVVLLLDNTVGEVWFFANVGGSCFACVSKWPTARRISNSCMVAQLIDNPVIVPLDSLLVSLIYRRSMSPPMVTVLLPTL